MHDTKMCSSNVINVVLSYTISEVTTLKIAYNQENRHINRIYYSELSVSQYTLNFIFIQFMQK